MSAMAAVSELDIVEREALNGEAWRTICYLFTLS
jgi:hypothetical protein